jgi:hypothetical protein
MHNKAEPVKHCRTSWVTGKYRENSCGPTVRSARLADWRRHMTTTDEITPIAVDATHHEIARLSVFTEELVKGCLGADENGSRHKLSAVLRVYSELGIIWRILSEIDVRGVMTKNQRQFLQDFYAGITY